MRILKIPPLIVVLVLLLASLLLTPQPALSSAPLVAPAMPNGYRVDVNMVPAAAFSSDGYIAGITEYFTSFNGGYITGIGTGAPSGCVKAPVYLRDGTMLSHVYASLVDNDADDILGFTFSKINNYTGVVTNLASINTAGYPVSDAIITPYSDITDQVVDYPTYSYYVTSCIQSDLMRIYSVRVYYYYYSITLPLILR